MLFRRILLLALVLNLCTKAYPAVFVVTSNADSGPGTLRDALTQAAANGNTAKDYINFNLPDVSEAGRIITLVSQLPALSSNLVIDGTTQPGTAFGQSNARVEISTPLNNNQFTIFNGTDLNDIEFYGLYIYDYSDNNNNDKRPGLLERDGISITNSSNIIFGAANKGNLIRGFNVHSLYLKNTDIISIQNNIIGLNSNNNFTDPNRPDLIEQTAGMVLSACNHIQIGGDNTQGNIIFVITDILDLPRNNIETDIAIKSNNFFVLADGKTNPALLNQLECVLISQTDASAKVNIDIQDNIVANYSTAFDLTGLKGVISFKRNFFNIARDGTSLTDYVGQNGNPILATRCNQLNIGSDNLTDKNFFANSLWVIVNAKSQNIFIRNNEYQCIGESAYVNFLSSAILPKIAITGSVSSGLQTTLSGTSDAGAIIDVYSSESCTYASCSIRKHVGNFIADNSGNWSGNAPTTAGIYYVSATVINTTSLFKTYEIDRTNAVINNFRCTNEGSITGVKVPAGLKINWTNSQGNIVSTDINLKTIIPGQYTLSIGDGCIKSIFNILDNRVIIDNAHLVITNPNCGKNDGAINGLSVNDPENKLTATLWFDENGKQVGNTTNITGLTGGNYTLKTFTLDGCEKDYGPVNLKKAIAPDINLSTAKIQSTGCGQATGSITNITVTGSGTIKYSWFNSVQQLVGSDKDLINQPAGTYTLQVTDDSPCGAILSPAFAIPETNGITLDETQPKITAASCNLSNGSITGIIATGATQYQWTDINNKVVATTADLQNAPAGDYILTALNTFGCSKTSKKYTITLKTLTVFPVYNVTVVPACYQQANGSVSVVTDDKVKSERWVNTAGQNIGNQSTINNLSSGAYQLYLTDQNGCESFYNNYTVPASEILQIVKNSEQITNPHCGLNTGGINSVQIIGGIPPYTYTWVNQTNNTVSQSANISGIGAGNYILYINDSGNCGPVSATYTLTEQDDAITLPKADNIQICNAGNITIRVNNPLTGYTYRLYDSDISTSPLDEQTNGVFKVNIPGNRNYYISAVLGTCESARKEITVSVGLSALEIANTFTPNGDGINDYWELKNFENYPSALIQVFNRYGQRVYESKGYSTPFNGTYNGKQLPVGTYYYIINLGIKCNILSGSLTLIR